MHDEISFVPLTLPLPSSFRSDTYTSKSSDGKMTFEEMKQAVIDHNK